MQDARASHRRLTGIGQATTPLATTPLATPARVTLALAAIALGACAPVPPGTPRNATVQTARTCFLPSQITNFREDTGLTLYVRAGRSDFYALETAGGCRDLESANAIVVTPELGSSRLCVGDGAVVTVPDARTTCRARVTRHLTDSETAALPGRLRP